MVLLWLVVWWLERGSASGWWLSWNGCRRQVEGGGDGLVSWIVGGWVGLSEGPEGCGLVVGG